MLDRDALAALGLVADIGAVTGAEADDIVVPELVRPRVVVEILAGQLDRVIGRRLEDELAEGVPDLGIDRVELVAAQEAQGRNRAAPAPAIGARLAQLAFLRRAVADADDRLEGGREAVGGDARLHERAVEAVIARVELDRPGLVLAALEQVLRIERAVRDDAAQRIGAPEHRARAAHDLDILEEGQIDEVAVAVGDALDHARTIDLHLHAVAADAADGEAAVVAERVGAARLAVDDDARLVAHEILRIAGDPLLHVLSRDHADGAGNIEHLLLATRRSDRDLVERNRLLAGIPVGLRCLRLRLSHRKGGRRQQCREESQLRIIIHHVTPVPYLGRLIV